MIDNKCKTIINKDKEISCFNEKTWNRNTYTQDKLLNQQKQ